MEFKVASVKVFNQVNRETGDTLNETVFKLNNAKEGYDEIVFQFREGEELKNLLLGFFQCFGQYVFDISKSWNSKIRKCWKRWGWKIPTIHLINSSES